LKGTPSSRAFSDKNVNQRHLVIRPLEATAKNTGQTDHGEKWGS
jgi:hypothetical protein